METQTAKKQKVSDDVRISGSVPLDLIPQIAQGLPVKSLARFLCVSKQYASIIRSRDFIRSYLNKPLTRPQDLIFTFKSKRYGKHFFFTSSQPSNRDESLSLGANYYMKSSSKPYPGITPPVHTFTCYGNRTKLEVLSSGATYHMNCNSQPYTAITPSVHGLICYGLPTKLEVYNPSTRRSITLPKIDSQRNRMYHYLGYDPTGGDYKMLCMTRGMHVRRGRGLAQNIQVLTLGNGNSWRMIEDVPPPHSPESTHICIDGVLYYGVYFDTSTRRLRDDHYAMSFDVRSEKFHVIKVPPESARQFTRMTKYNGKLALMFHGYGGVSFTYPGRLELWVLEDAEKHEWSEKIFPLPRIEVADPRTTMFQVFCAVDDDDDGEFVLAPETLCAPPFYVLYYDPKKNSVRRVDVEGIIEKKLQFWDNDLDRRTISIFPGQVENLMFL